MQPKQLIEIMAVAERLKDNTRHCITSKGRKESVAEHSWRLTLMAMFMQDEYPDIDMLKLLKMCVIHDIGECFTGDVPSFEKTDAHREAEDKMLKEWVASLPAPYDKEFAELYAEMEQKQTQEAKLYKALDNMEAVVQHNEAPIESWLPLEYDLQLTYGKENVQFSEYTRALHAQLNEDTREKIKNGK